MGDEFVCVRKPDKTNWLVLHKGLLDIVETLEDLDFNPNLEQQQAIFTLLETQICQTYGKQLTNSKKN